MKILCLSVHPVLEYDELRLFESMGHRVFSLGFYFHRATTTSLRPPLAETGWHRECVDAFTALGCNRVAGEVSWQVTSSFCSMFDVVIVHHNHAFIEANWEALCVRPVVWRTIGQGLHWAENAARPYRERGIKIVRWSPEEQFIDGYIGADAVIRTAKDPEDWKGWDGSIPRIVTFNNNFRFRGEGLSFSFHQQVVASLPFDLYGLGNGDMPNWRGVATADEQQAILRNYRVAFVTGTNPAPYTLGFIEAWMTGIPVVHVGRQRFAGSQAGVYEIDHLIEHGVNGFLVNEVAEAVALLTELVNDKARCQAVSEQGRRSAINYFGYATAQTEWAKFFNDHIDQG